MTKAKKQSKSIELSLGKPLDSAKQFLALMRPNLIRHDGLWLDWKGGCYSAVESETILSEITAFCDGAVMTVCEKSKNKKGEEKLTFKSVPFIVTPVARKKIYDMLADVVHKPSGTMSPPCWLDGRAGPDPRNVMSCENGLLDIMTRDMIDPTPAFFTLTTIPVEYNPKAPEPKLWNTYLDQTTATRDGVPRPHLKQTLQETTGYLLSSDTSLQKLFQFIGPTRSGKGTYMRVLNALLGPNNISNPSMGDLAEKYGNESLEGKSVCMVTDADTGDTKEVGRAAANVNRISGEDRVNVRRMGIKSLTAVKLLVRFVLGGNHLPNFGKHTAALLARLIVIPFDVSLPEAKQDTELTDKLLAELPSILNWALDGLAELRKRGKFVEPPESRAIKERLTSLSSIVISFMRDKCMVSPKSRIDAGVLFNAFHEYVTENKGRGMSAEDFAEAIRDLTKGAAERGARGHAGKDGRVFRGIRLNDTELVERYQHDTDLVKLFGKNCVETLKRDDEGWLVPKVCRDFN